MTVPDTGYYEASRRSINDQYGTDSTMNAYGRFLSQQRGSRSLGDMTQGFQRGYAPMRSQYGARGLSGGGLRSGAMQGAMQRYVGDYYQNYGRQAQDITQGLQQYDLEQARLNSWRTRSMADLDLQQAQEIARAAQNIEALKQYYGGA